MIMIITLIIDNSNSSSSNNNHINNNDNDDNNNHNNHNYNNDNNTNNIDTTTTTTNNNNNNSNNMRTSLPLLVLWPLCSKGCFTNNSPTIIVKSSAYYHSEHWRVDGHVVFFCRQRLPLPVEQRPSIHCICGHAINFVCSIDYARS